MQKFDKEDVVILLVEDDKITVSLLTKLLNVMGAKEILTARNGADGLEMAFEKRPSLVICDINMAPVDGLAFLGGLRATTKAEVAAIPVIMFSSNEEPELLERAKKLGIGGYLVKPFNPKGLSEVINGVLSGKSDFVVMGEKPAEAKA